MTPEIMEFILGNKKDVIEFNRLVEEVRLISIMAAYQVAYDFFAKYHPQAGHDDADEFARFITKCYAKVPTCNESS